MDRFGSTSPFSPMAQWRSVDDDFSATPMIPPSDFGGPVFRSLAPLELGAPFQTKPSFSKEIEGDFALGIQKGGDSFGMLGLLPRSGPSSELPLVPAWVCVHTSFVVRLPPAAAFAKILDILRSPTFGITVDVQPQNEKFQMKGKGVRNDTMTYFKKKMYRNLANEVVVECTRQDGCVVLFNKVYQKLLGVLGEEARRLSDTGMRPATLPDLRVLPPPSLAISHSGECNVSLLRTLLLRAGSQFLDEQFQACQALVSISASSSESVWRELGDVDVPSIVTLLLQSESEDTAELAALLLSNLFKFHFRESPSLALITALFTLLDSPPTFKNQDTKRHVSSCLRVIALGRKQKFSASQRNTLEFYQHSPDPVINGNAAAILKCC